MAPSEKGQPNAVLIDKKDLEKYDYQVKPLCFQDFEQSIKL